MNPLNELATNELQLANALVLQSVLAVMAANLNQIKVPSTSKMEIVQDGNLYALAAKYYQNALQWPLIALANNLVDPQVVGLATLIIPPPSSTQYNGVFTLN